MLNGINGTCQQEDGTYKFGKTHEDTYNFSDFVFNQNIPDSVFVPDLSGIKELEIVDHINNTTEIKHL
jgi:outer membrane lipoprotein-sorting protein